MASRTLTAASDTGAGRTGRPDAAPTGGGAGQPPGTAHRLASTDRVRRGRSRSRIRGQWLVLATALTVLAGLLVAWSLERAADRVEVVSVAQPVPAGTVIGPGDLTTTAIAFDTPVVGLAPAASLDSLVGRVATVDLEPGVLLSTAMWADGSEVTADERTVGALLVAGTHPGGITPGSLALAVSTGDDETLIGDDSVVASPRATAADVPVRVLDADVDDRGSLRVTLAVPASEAARIARLAAADMLVLVGVPAVADPVGSADAAP